MAAKRVYFFGGGKAEGNGSMKDVLGGKGAGLAEMTNLGVPVPPGFTVSTEACNLYYKHRGKLPKDLISEIAANLARLERAIGKKLGDPKNPLLVSVRSGSKFSMPGMMDTVLNLGLNDKTVEGLALKSGNPRFAYDSYRRFLMMFSDVVLDLSKNHFEHVFEAKKLERGAAYDVDLTAEDLMDLCRRFKALVKERLKKEFPQDPQVQLGLARDAVFRSWNNDRAKYYRKANGIPDDIGTAVNVQAMVFGNMGDDCATGVGFTRNPATGAKEFYGEYLVNAQGEDVVAGIRTPHPIRDMKREMPKVFDQLMRITGKLEKHYKDVQDFEFTVESNTLYMLQTRNGKRTASAAVKIAVDMVKEKLITKEEALLRLEPQQIDQLLHPVIDPKAKVEVIAKGLPASPGAATGAVVFHANKAVEWATEGKDVILVRKETSPDDIHGMDVARGILTAKGGMTSHAAVVARQMGKTCVAGCSAIDVDETTNRFMVGGRVVREGEYISLNGSTGEVILGKAPLIAPAMTGAFGVFMSWADAVRRLKVRANADTPRDARVARDFGAEGIGLCRTEHMFFAEDRIPIMQEMILARTREDREAALAKLLPMQRNDFKGLYREMKGYPVTIRLLDPPLHEFLPRREDLMVEVTKLELIHADRSIVEEKKRLLERVEELHEFNPMLGLRGCRLGIYYPEITRMQARAIFEAACEVTREGIRVHPEVMIPLVSMVGEMRAQKEIVVAAAEETMRRQKKKFPYTVGTMIELPRAAVTADEIATEAEFFSFGTNDLTQTTFGFSRDDSGKFIQHYMNRSELCPQCGTKLEKDLSCVPCKVTYTKRAANILDADVFATLDQDGVGKLVRMGVEKGRSTRPDLKVGICGEHGGDPKSVEFCHRTGLDYVSCSPYRVPIARLAAAQAVLREKMEGKRRKK
ncbi:MAG: pyruvate, phosphate dikinase [Deltaproteobacteria bacterium GWB2_65_81]|nr:MAG: pyruvate, phosphate dikinase [Deltaproteobacteria bacterium GWA2_65_63]OGP26012.1 MAG: pyruvate, phosphate dikinase [Deltaproteobacteria bacterium GWB2_65_81]OGP36168.1 MAG: pyruvate, phosphate dikinase [Deltaproteobacteria bacterium GWC2_66_88]HAM32422.1 pyruvate, phosphate dikinase [Deltaproteobacteria bacterium]